MIGLGGLVDTQGRVFNLMQDDGEFFIQAERGPVVLRVSGDYAEKIADAIKAERALLARQAGAEQHRLSLEAIHGLSDEAPPRRRGKKKVRG